MPGASADGSQGRTLLGLSYSPWSQKARWALDHLGVAYRWREYTPVIGEPALRLKLRRLRGRVSVPVLFDGDAVIDDSLAIAEHGDRISSGDLFPDRAAVAGYDRLAQEALAEARARVIAALAASPKAQEEALAGAVPKRWRRRLRFVVRRFSLRTARKYQETAVPGSARVALETLRRDLDASGGVYLLGSFSYADMAMGVMIDLVEPPADRFVRRGPGTRACWRDEELALEFAELVSWRDRLYEAHRAPCLGVN